MLFKATSLGSKIHLQFSGREMPVEMYRMNCFCFFKECSVEQMLPFIYLYSTVQKTTVFTCKLH